MTAARLPRCDLTDLVRLMCAHCRREGFTLTDEEERWLKTPPAEPAPTITTTAAPQRITPISSYQTGRGWAGTEDGSPPAGTIDCEADGHDRGDSFMCRACIAELVRHLRDVPQLVDDLTVAFQKDVSFAERASQGSADEAPVNFNIAASSALDQLRRALPFSSEVARDRARFHPAILASASRWLLANLSTWLKHPTCGRSATAIAQACVHARSVIDRPKDLTYYGTCPECERDIIQERVNQLDKNARIVCPNEDCTYAAKYSDHELYCLNLGEDRWLTIDEMIGAIRAGDEVVLRRDLTYWIEREGLPQEERSRPTLVAGEIVDRPVKVYRLGDVRALARAAELDRRSLTTAEAAVYLDTSTDNIRQMVRRGKLEPNDRGRNPLRFRLEVLDAAKADRSP